MFPKRSIPGNGRYLCGFRTQASEASMALARLALLSRRGSSSGGLVNERCTLVLASELDFQHALHLSEDGLEEIKVDWVKLG